MIYFDIYLRKHPGATLIDYYKDRLAFLTQNQAKQDPEHPHMRVERWRCMLVLECLERTIA